MFSLFKSKPKNTATSTATANVQKSKPKIVSLIFSHNSRMQCFIERFKKESMKSEKIRFKNGAIIKLVVENNKITPSLVYEGELDEKETKKIVKKGAYYTKNKNTFNKNITNLSTKVNSDKELQKYVSNKKIILSERFKKFSDYFGDKDLSILQYLTKEKTIEFDSSKTYEFYIIRHGQGIHNGVGAFTKAKDPKYKDATLTDEGKKQAQRSGEKLNTILGSDKVNYLFATDLRRTRETLVEVLGKLNNKPNPENTKIIILPCSHEISVEKDKILNLKFIKVNRSCDALEAWSTSKAAGENFPVCTKTRINNKNNNNECVKKGGYSIDWSYYLAFYNNSMRGDYTRTSARLHCRNTNMIIEALNIIKNGATVKNQYKKNINSKKLMTRLFGRRNTSSSFTQIETDNYTNNETSSNITHNNNIKINQNNNIKIKQTNLNKIQAITKILENNIAKYEWTNPPKNLLEMRRQMRSIGNKIKVNNKGSIKPNDMKMAKENYDKLSEIENKINKTKLTNEMKKISSNRLTPEQKRLAELKKKHGY
jgi:broad specificity phosphatase PhoE